MPMNMESARQQMVSQQVRAWTVLDPAVLRVLSEVPRERFVPPACESLAFADTTILLPEGQQMMAPKVEGRILQALEIAAGDVILEVGTGSGFLTACLARLGGHVTSLEIRPGLADAARRRLREAAIANCEVVVADAFQWRPEQQFNCIVIGGSLPLYDARFQDWLAPGGRLFAVVGEEPAMEACLLRRTDAGQFTRESLFETVLPALDNAPRPEPFSF